MPMKTRLPNPIQLDYHHYQPWLNRVVYIGISLGRWPDPNANRKCKAPPIWRALFGYIDDEEGYNIDNWDLDDDSKSQKFLP
jgi:hypothetical protein